MGGHRAPHTPHLEITFQDRKIGPSVPEGPVPCTVMGSAIIRLQGCSHTLGTHVAPGPSRGPSAHKSGFAV